MRLAIFRITHINPLYFIFLHRNSAFNSPVSIRMKFWRAIILSVVVTATAVPTINAADAFPDVKDLPIQTNLPDVMTMGDGTKVTTLAQWRARREEMKAILEHYELGHAPPPPGNVRGQDINRKACLMERQRSGWST